MPEENELDFERELEPEAECSVFSSHDDSNAMNFENSRQIGDSIANSHPLRDEVRRNQCLKRSEKIESKVTDGGRSQAVQAESVVGNIQGGKAKEPSAAGKTNAELYEACGLLPYTECLGECQAR